MMAYFRVIWMLSLAALAFFGVLFVTVIVFTFISEVAFSDHVHNWTLESRFTDDSGRVKCEWACIEGEEPHYRNTTGQGGCSAPMS